MRFNISIINFTIFILHFTILDNQRKKNENADKHAYQIASHFISFRGPNTIILASRVHLLSQWFQNLSTYNSTAPKQVITDQHNSWHFYLLAEMLPLKSLPIRSNLTINLKTWDGSSKVLFLTGTWKKKQILPLVASFKTNYLLLKEPLLMAIWPLKPQGSTRLSIRELQSEH